MVKGMATAHLTLAIGWLKDSSFVDVLRSSEKAKRLALFNLDRAIKELREPDPVLPGYSGLALETMNLVSAEVRRRMTEGLPDPVLIGEYLTPWNDREIRSMILRGKVHWDCPGDTCPLTQADEKAPAPSQVP